MHCDAEGGKTASGGDRLALDESKRLASRTAAALLQWSKSRMLGAAGKGPLPQHRRKLSRRMCRAWPQSDRASM